MLQNHLPSFIIDTIISHRYLNANLGSWECNQSLPNVGKSALFNAIIGREVAKSGNRPFTTIEPNFATVKVPDLRLKPLANQAGTTQLTFASVDLVDIAGLVPGASEGKGLGNQFLSHIRTVQSLIHVIRCFDDPLICHVEGETNPIRDLNTIHHELIQKDKSLLSSLSRTKSKQSTFDVKLIQETIDMVGEALNNLKSAGSIIPQLKKEQVDILNSFNLLTSKPIILCCNVEETAASTGNLYSKLVMDWAKSNQYPEPIVVSAKLESELFILEDDEIKRKELFESYGLMESSLTRIITETYKLLGLMTFYTAGPKEARAWRVLKGANARDCAAEIHTDIAKGFIKAETCSYQDWIDLGPKKAKEMKKIRLEGPTYIVQDGDVMLFKFKNMH